MNSGSTFLHNILHADSSDISKWNRKKACGKSKDLHIKSLMGFNIVNHKMNDVVGLHRQWWVQKLLWNLNLQLNVIVSAICESKNMNTWWYCTFYHNRRLVYKVVSILPLHLICECKLLSVYRIECQSFHIPPITFLIFLAGHHLVFVNLHWFSMVF